MVFQKQATFQEALRSAIVENYCNFEGRASRSQYWWYVLFTALLGFLIGIIFGEETTGNIIQGIVTLALLLPGLGLAVRRLHDIGKSGWWIFLAFIPLVGAIILIVWFCQNSQMFPNQYGEVPMLEERP
ncbi:MAG: DUF805 domain-containing protein [Bacteroides sp.]|nr:DUF805 domain-containing protein [Bacteroides sp.]